MTRYAPTLFVGLGGSGIAVLRWVRWFLKDELEHEPVKFCGIDFDRSDRPDGDAEPLGPGEYFYFSPAPIAECVRAINNRVAGPPPRVALAHEKIRLWYPDPDGHSIRYGQAETAGARQWRPLGRMGFFLYDAEIMSAVSTRLTMLEKVRGNEPPTVIIVSSIAGGTGSGMLLDVAALLRKGSPNLSVRAVLLLPEFFEHVDFGSKIAANGYATLWEIANYKNRFSFEADYPRVGKIDAQQSSPPLQRVYVVGPYIGDRRPFLSPGEGYPHIAKRLRILITSTLRSNAQSYQTNDDADGNVARQDPGAVEVFCSFSSTSILLVSWENFAMFLVRGLAVEATDRIGRSHPLFDQLTKSATDGEVDEIAKIIMEAVKPGQAQIRLTENVVTLALENFFRSEAPKKWNEGELVDFIRKLQSFCDEFPNESNFLEGSPGPLRHSCRELEEQFALKLDALKKRLWQHPAALDIALSRLSARLRAGLILPTGAPVLAPGNFAKWLDKRFGHWILSIPILQNVRLRVLRHHARKKLVARFAQHGESLFEHALLAVARARLAAVTKDWREGWEPVEAFAKKAVADVDKLFSERDTRDIRRESLGYRDVDVVATLESELGRVPVDIASKIREDLASAFHEKQLESRTNSNAVAELAAKVELLLAELRRQPNVTEPATYVPIKSVYSDAQISDAILSCATPTFRPGRLDSILRRRTVRIVAPKELQGPPRKYLEQKCESLLGAHIQNVPPDESEKAILILVEELFHPAEDIAGIYDYRNAYEARPNPQLFHIDYRLTKTFPDLLASSGTENPVLCGNYDCPFDLRATPRTTLLCPACGRPIRNRCGNDCRLNALASRDDLAGVIQAGICPGCKKPLATYWWKCARHGLRVSMEKAHCPDCVREKRVRPETRPGSSDHYVCPNCIRQGAAKPFAAEGELAEACRNGANGHDRDDVEKATGNALSDGGLCPKCGTQLIPYCPVTTPRRHFLHRPSEDDRWFCYVDPELELFACSVCAYPVRKADPACPRCQTPLTNCAHCTAHAGLRVPVETLMGRCVRCRLPIDDRSMVPMPDDVFCSNIYLCQAGSQLDQLTFPRNLERCPLCSELLRPLFTRDDLIASCKFCSQLFPSLASTSQQSRADDGMCPLCCQTYADTSGVARAHADDELTIARVLLKHRDDRKAMREIYERTPAGRRLQLGDVLIAFGYRIVRGRNAKRIALRLRRIIDFLAELLPTAPKGNSSEAETMPPAGAPPHLSQPRRVDELISLEHMLEVQANDSVEEWVAELLGLSETAVSIRAALGRTLVDTHDEVRARRLQDFRAEVSRRLDEIDHSEE